MEIFFVDVGSGGGSATGPSVFFTLGSELERDDVAAVIADQPSIGANLPGGRAAASACGSILEVHNPASCTSLFPLEIFTSNIGLQCYPLFCCHMQPLKGTEVRSQHRDGYEDILLVPHNQIIF